MAAGGEPDLVLANEEPARRSHDELTALDLLPRLDPRDHLELHPFTRPGRREQIVRGRDDWNVGGIRPAENRARGSTGVNA